MKEKKFKHIKKVEHDGLVVINVEDPEEWGKGVQKMLVELRLVKDEDQFDSMFYLKNDKNLYDVVIPFKEKAKLKMGLMTGWKKLFGRAEWVDDYITQHEKDVKE